MRREARRAFSRRPTRQTAYFGEFDQPDRLKAITHFGAIRSLRECYRRSGSDAVRMLPLGTSC
jgi:hypothetical protein